MIDRLERVRQTVDEILQQQPDLETRRWGYVHLYGVSATCAFLAFKRGLDAQLAAVAGMLHDIWTYKSGDATDHARLSALDAEKILKNLGGFGPEEIVTVCGAIARHSAKEASDGAYAELLKDADVLQHGLNNPIAIMKMRESNQTLPGIAAAWRQRWNSVSCELGLLQIHVADE